MSDYNGFGSIDLSDVSESGEQRKTIPAGNHIVKVVSAAMKDTSKGGKMLEVKFENDEGQYVLERLNLVHKTSQQAVDIGKRKLKELLVCGGHPTPDKPGSVESLVGLRLGARIVSGQDWRDKEGNVRPGGGELRSTAPFFKPDDGSVTIGEAPKDDQMFGKSDSKADTKSQSEDEKGDDNIPF